jgi:hypothetical protein
MTIKMTFTTKQGYTEEVKQTGNRFFFYCRFNARWMPVKKALVLIEEVSAVEVLAEEMGVEAVEVKAFAESIANSIKQDKVDLFFVNNASEEEKKEITIAYAQHAVRKIQEFHTAYMTNDGVRGLFRDMVYSGLKFGEVS